MYTIPSFCPACIIPQNGVSHTAIQITTTRLKHGEFEVLRFLSPPWSAVDQRRYIQLGNPAQGEHARGQLARVSLARVWERNEKRGNDHCILGKLLNSLRWPIYVINSVDNTKLPCYTLPPTRHHIFLGNLSLYSFAFNSVEHSPKPLSISR